MWSLLLNEILLGFFFFLMNDLEFIYLAFYLELGGISIFRIIPVNIVGKYRNTVIDIEAILYTEISKNGPTL